MKRIKEKMRKIKFFSNDEYCKNAEQDVISFHFFRILQKKKSLEWVVLIKAFLECRKKFKLIYSPLIFFILSKLNIFVH